MFAVAPQHREGFRAAIVFIDLDGFKRINDTLGHAGGDALLAEAARRLLEQGLDRDLQSIDTCLDGFGMPCDRLPKDIVFARFAGDEFVAILPGTTDRQQLAEVGERIVRSLAAPFHIQGQMVSVSGSVGIAVTPDDTTDPNEILAFADLVMYGSKQAGKARYQFFEQQARQDMLQATRVEAELRVALAQGQSLLHYQPKFRCEGYSVSQSTQVMPTRTSPRAAERLGQVRRGFDSRPFRVYRTRAANQPRNSQGKLVPSTIDLTSLSHSKPQLAVRVPLS